MLFHESISLRHSQVSSVNTAQKKQLVDKKATFQRVADSHSTLTL
jgi:hypothetical protein